MSLYNYRRRPTCSVTVGNVSIGSDHPVRLQSMTNLSTNDIDGCIEQSMRVAEAGGEIIRVTTQGVREARSAALIRNGLRERGCGLPVVADVHFNREAAFEAAKGVDKVRINPGNFADAARTFKQLNYTDEEYNAELQRIRNLVEPFLDHCRQTGVAIRLGVNHGSLSDRIMSRYGDTPEGMVESVMEYLRIAQQREFDDIVISIKASDAVVMTRTVRLLVAAMDAEDMHYPLHLGVTEAGDGADGRIKSAVGIGALLAAGIGDTIRVSLSEEPEAEIPVAKALADYIALRKDHAPVEIPATQASYPSRDSAYPFEGFENAKWPLVIGHDLMRGSDWHFVDASQAPVPTGDTKPVVVTSSHINAPGEIASWIERFIDAGGKNPIVVSLSYEDDDSDSVRIKAAADFGAILLNGHASAIEVIAPALSIEERNELALSILQSAGLRVSKTEFISCPGCGRTLFDLQTTVRAVKEATSHLKGLKIGVMGCIVNGPGEMAGAHYGYVGAARGKVSLYKGKECIERNIPENEAIPRLVQLIKENGDWKEPDCD